MKLATRMVRLELELKNVPRHNDGRLLVSDVLRWAREHPESAWYKRLRFDDDSALAEEYRKVLVRNVLQNIDIRVEMPGPDDRLRSVSVTRFVHLRAEPVNGEPVNGERGGYHEIKVVLADPVLRDEMLRQARVEYLSFRHKYEHLKELADLFAVGNTIFA